MTRLEKERKNIARRYMTARTRWVAAGKPRRTPEEIEEILETHCKPCDFYMRMTRRAGRCRKCGCMLNLSSKRLNKLAMATESCPLNPPRWTAKVTEDNMEAIEIQPVETRRQRRIREREERRKQREERVAKRAAVKEVMLGAMPPAATLTTNSDPLSVCGPHKTEINHALRDLWKLRPAFLVCGGPSLNSMDLSELSNQAVCSMGVNNAAAHVPVKSFVCGDPIEKFHHSIFLNPGLIKFVPRKKLGHRVRGKKPDGTFQFTVFNCRDCPNVFGFDRNSTWSAEEFLSRPVAMWGVGQDCAEKLNMERVLFTPLLGLRLLHYLGCPRVYLLGVDFDMTPGETGGYAFPQGRTQGAASGNNAHYRRVDKMLQSIRPVMEAAQFYVYNCNPNSRCSAFDYVPYKTALADCLAMMPTPPHDLSGWYEKDIRKDPMSDDEEEEREFE